MKRGKVSIVIDGQWGSTGKGKVAGYLALKHNITASVCNFMSNAGHTFRHNTLGKFMVQQIPVAAVNRNTELFIAAGAAITPSLLMKEIEMFEAADLPVRDRLRIDAHATIIRPHHIEEEAYHLGRISSTLKGCGAALASKVMRKTDVELAKDVEELRPYICNVSEQLRSILAGGGRVLGEMAQGFDLSLNHGFYPYVTSRDITPCSFMSDIGLPHTAIGHIYGVLRTYPIRVGNVVVGDQMVGYSGPFYDDQVETSWQEISQKIGKQVEEKTTVTGKIRRVFTFSFKQLKKFTEYCAPDCFAINFCDYLQGQDEMDKLYGKIESVGGKPIVFFGTGPENYEMYDREQVLDRGVIS